MRGLKRLVRSYIQQADIKETPCFDTFKILVKYDNDFVCEDLCGDIYRKCTQTIAEHLEDEGEFITAVEDVIGDDLEMKSNVLKRMKLEFAALKTETNAADDTSSLKRKFEEMEDGEEETVSKHTKLLDSTKSQLKKDQMPDAKQNKVSETEKDITKCSNCGHVDCRDGQLVNRFRFGFTSSRVVSLGHLCTAYPGGEEAAEIEVIEGIEGIQKISGIAWDYGFGKVLICNCKQRGFCNAGYHNVVYKCKKRGKKAL